MSLVVEAHVLFDVGLLAREGFSQAAQESGFTTLSVKGVKEVVSLGERVSVFLFLSALCFLMFWYACVHRCLSAM